MKTHNLSPVNKVEPRATVRLIPAVGPKMTKTNTIPKKRVCAYCRVSTDQEEQQTSYELQVEHYTDFIQKNELWEFCGVYADEGISGTSIKNRTDFLRMIDDCKAGKIDFIITKSISRFARNTLDCLSYVRLLKGLSSPVGIYFEKENLDTLDSKSELLLTILSSLAQDESRSISENVRWALQKRYQQGKAFCPTTNFLGYDSDSSGNMVINEEQAETVRWIFQKCLEGYGTGLIAKRLTADGVKTGTGNTQWVGNSVYRILRNEKYSGDVLLQKRVTVDFLTHKREPNRGQQPQYFIQDHHPAIISRDDWNAVQAELDRRANMNQRNKKGKPQRHSNRSIFSNIFYCGTCGEPLVRRTFTSTYNKDKYLYPAWKCRVADGRIKDKECHAKSYREESMEHAFMVMLLEMKNDKESWLNETEAAIADKDCDEWEKERMEFLQTEIESVNERLSEMATSAEKSSAPDVYQDLSVDLTQQLEVLQSEWEQLQRKKGDALTLSRTLKWLLGELDRLKDFNPASERVNFREDIFRRIVKRGDVFDDGSILYEFVFGTTRKANDNDNMIWKTDRLPKF